MQVQQQQITGKRNKVKVKVNMSKNVIKRDSSQEEPGTLITYTKMAASPYAPEEIDELYQPIPMYTEDT